MAAKNQVTLTFAGDADDLSKTFDKVNKAAGDTEDRVKTASKSTEDGFHRAGEAADNTYDKFDSLEAVGRGTTDTMSGLANIMAGNVLQGSTDLAGGVAALADGFKGALLPAMKSVLPAMKAAATATKAFTLSLLTNPVFLIATAVALLVAGLVILYKKSEDVRRVVDFMGHAFEVTTSKVIEATKAVANFATESEKSGSTVKSRLGDPMTYAHGAVAGLISGLPGGTLAMGAFGLATKKSGDETEKAAEQIGVADQLQKNYNTTQLIAKSRAEGLSKAVQDQTAYFDDLLVSMRKASGQALTLSESQIAYEQSVDDATAALKANGKNIDINTQKGRDNRVALNQVAQAANDQTEAIARTTGNLGTASKTAQTSKDNFQKLAEKMGYSKTQAKQLADKLIAIPNVNRTVTITTKEIQHLIKVVETHYASVIGGKTDYFGNPITPKGRAVGGPVSAGMPYIVGENGPEIMVPDTNGTIIPNGGGGSGGGGRMVLELRSSGQRTDDLLVQLLRNAIKVKGGNVQVVLGT